MLAGLFVLALIIYWPALRGPLIWDDAVMLGPLHPTASGLADIWRGNQVDYFPMTSTVFWFFRHFWGDAPTGYRVVNLALHAGNAMLLWHILKNLKIPGAGLSAFIFCAHPICVDSVAWIAELKNTLSLFFALLTGLFFLASQKKSLATFYYGLALVCFLLGLLSKISVAMLPFVLTALVCGRQWLNREEVPAGDGRKGLARLWPLLPFFGLALALGLVGIGFQQHNTMVFETTTDREPLLMRLLGGGYAAWFYVWKVILPWNLMPVYPRWRIDSANWLDWLPTVGWVVFLGVIGWLAKVRRQPVFRAVLFGAGFFLVTLLPVLGPVQISYFFISRVGDHLAYLSIIGIIALAGGMLAGLSLRWPAEWRKYMFVPLVALLGFASWQRAHLYAHPEQLWRDNLAKNPGAGMAWANLAGIVLDQGQLDEASRDYAEAIRLDPGNISVRASYAVGLSSAGRNEEAIGQYREIISRQPNNPELHSTFAAVLWRAKHYEEAVAQFGEVVRLAPDYPKAQEKLRTAQRLLPTKQLSPPEAGGNPPGK